MIARRLIPACLLVSVALAPACASRRQPAPRPTAKPPPGQPSDAGLSELEQELQHVKDSLAEVQRDNQELRRQLEEEKTAAVRAEEASATLEVELGEALDELLRL